MSASLTNPRPRAPTCAVAFQPASFDELSVMSSAQATNTVVRMEAIAGKVRCPLRTASRSARRMLMDERRFGERHRMNR